MNSHMVDDTVANRLLADSCSIFTRRNKTKLRSMRLIYHLCSDPLWATFNNGKPITARQLSALLRPVGITRKDMRFRKGIGKGYRAEWFSDALNEAAKSNGATVCLHQQHA